MSICIDIDKLALQILENLFDEVNTIWKQDSKYRKFRDLQIDKRGSFGERFFSQVLLLIYNRRIEYNDGDQGDWDLKINNLKLEVKTSSIDVNGKFQNEGLKKDGDYDGILFLGIMPNDLCIKFVKKSEIPFDVLHSREKAKTGRGHKWDFKENEMLKVRTIEDVKNEYERVFGDEN